ncbi:hypothetical protein SAMN04489761_0391 [Tenacibaculum sp. MAR_2009_124]|uniref:hypothetical protein n=1 Tax=Tenacibaculum sp. MAR_2009_124 TaxID=1250059 RepID=UPI0008958826|nr:hypothetical protein [Tenacibaculum sp. MAR_2009_124]SEB39160.1 hypothetical protein SAMN04489761_0391 [Tenacibaculum sp. MAR_2009_124]
MKVKTTYTSSIEYINNLEFDYFETYSLLRGGKYDGRIVHDPEYKEFQLLKKKKKLSELDILRLEKLNKLYGVTQYVVNSEGMFHPSAEKTGTYKIYTIITEKLKSILNTPIKEVPNWMCAPVYRDAIVFYNSDDKIVSTLNICLSCEYMETKMFHYINADTEAYNLMRELFIELGHKVEEK